jgi:glycosyltransferase involved in cell wall biosynthesis
MNYSDKITICIPVYNRTEYFQQALESALNQTIKCKVIVVDNGSSTNYFEVTSNKYKVDYFKNLCNIGMFANWNLCFKLCQSEFVTILGDDDILENTYVEEFKKTLESNTFDVFLSNIQVLRNINSGDIVPWFGKEMGREGREYMHGKFEGLYLLRKDIDKLSIPSLFCAIRRTKILEIPFLDNFHSGNDWLWHYLNANNNSYFYNSKNLGTYRYHGKNDSTTNVLITQIVPHISIHFFIYLKLRSTFPNEAILSLNTANKYYNEIPRKQRVVLHMNIIFKMKPKNPYKQLLLKYLVLRFIQKINFSNKYSLSSYRK